MKAISGKSFFGRMLLAIPGTGVGLVMAAFLFSNASACSCLAPESARQALETTPYVAWVRVLSKSIQGEDRVFQAEAWTGKGAVAITITSGKESSLCGTDLALDKPILLGMRKNNGQFQTDLCTRFAIDRFHDDIARMIKQCKPFGPCPSSE